MKSSIVTRTLLLLSLTIPALAQQPAPAANQPILIDAVVTKSNHPVPNLKQQDFTVLDNGQPANITLFQSHNIADTPANGVDASTNVIILLDEVNMGFAGANIASQGIQIFLRQNNGNLRHPVTLAFLTDTGLQIQTEPAVDGNALAAAVSKHVQAFRTIDEATQYGGAERMNLSLNAIDRLIATERTLPGRKLVLWIGPGWPYFSDPRNVLTPGQQQQTLASAIKLNTGLRQARITIDSISAGLARVGTSYSRYYEGYLQPLTDPRKATLADLSLQVLAVQSGGRVLLGNDLVQNYLNNAIEDLNAFYTLEINPAPSTQPTQFHTIDIKLSNPQLKVLTRNGYYSPAN